MRIPKLLRTNVFQLTLVYVALFGLSVAALSGFVYWSTIGYLERQTDAVIEAELTGLYEQQRRLNTLGLMALVEERLRRDGEGRSVYLLADPFGNRLAGNVPYWPPELAATPDKWVDFIKRDENGVETPVRAAVGRIGTGLFVLVGRDIRELAAINRVFRDAALYGVTLTMALALAGGVLLALGAQRRLAEINRTTREIMAGDLSRRAPIRGSHDEHDELAANINAMLDKIEALLAGMRHVGDSVAHDLRGPLTRLRNRLETLAEAAAPSRSDLADCVAQTEGVLATFNALLRIARVESGAYRSAFAAVDLERIVGDVCELYQAAADERRIELICDATRAVEVYGDRELLAQALTNVLDNAVKYTPAGGRIVVVLARSGDKARLTVADSGPGIPAADRERVQQRFTRLDRARSLPGNGLGLALVKAVAEQHHGRLTLDDNGPGLIVTLELPALALRR